MREMGIAGIAPGPNLSKRHPEHKVYPYLLRGLRLSVPIRSGALISPTFVWRDGWMYLVAILDWFSRYVVAWELDQTLEMPFVLQAVDRALSTSKPEIWNSDQGSHFTSPQYTQRLLAAQGPHQHGRPGPRPGQHLHRETYGVRSSTKKSTPRLHFAPPDPPQGIERYLNFYNL